MSEKISTNKENYNIEVKEEVELEEIAELEAGLKNILGTLRESIDNNNYGLIIGDDVSGRIPAIILKRVIDSVYEKKGLDAIPTRFIAGAKLWEMSPQEKLEKESKIDKYIQQSLLGLIQGKRVLIVTEVIITGSSLEILCSKLRGVGIDFDIASIGFSVSKDFSEIEQRLHSKIYTGGKGTPSIHSNKKLSGVVKKDLELFSRPIRSQDEMSDKESSSIQNDISIARKDANIVADHLIHWYESLKQ